MGGEEMFSFEGGWLVFIGLIIAIDVVMFIIGRKFTRKV